MKRSIPEKERGGAAEERVEMRDDPSDPFVFLAGGAVCLSEAEQRPLVARHAAVLDALPSHLALLDKGGRIISVNRAWLEFAAANDLHGGGVGDNYLEVCEAAEGAEKAEARRVAQGIRAVLRGEAARFELEYPCHSPHARRWFKLLAAPLRGPWGECAVVMHIDITARCEMEERLRESQALFRVMADQAPVMIWISGVDKACYFFNQKWLDFTGHTMEKEVGDGWTAGVHPEDLDRCWQTYASSFDARRSFQMEYRLRRHDGAYRWLLDTGVPRLSPAGEFLGYIGSCVDVTDRRREEAERLRLAAIVESSTDAIIGKSLDGTILSWNRGAEQLYGYTAEEIIGRSIQLIVPPERRGEVAAIHRQLERGEQPEKLETVRLRKDGRRLDVSLSFSPIRGPEGELNGVSMIARDITERKHAERAVAMQAHMLDAVEQAVIATDLAGTVIYWNQFAARLFGWTEREALGRNVIELTPAEISHDEAQTIFSHLRGGQSWSGEIYLRRRDGSVFPAAVTDSPIYDEEGKVVGIVGVSADITKRRRAEAELRISHEQMRALSAHLNSVREEERINIAREVHDELGQALTGLRMDVAWLSKRLADNEAATPALAEKLASMSTLIDDTIHTVRRIATELRPGVLDDLGLVAAIEWQAQEFEARTGIRCHFDLSAEEIETDPERSTAVFRIFQEVLTNIARHARATRVEIRLREEAGELTLTVRDNGRGINQEAISDTSSLGLLGMRERAYPFGGRLTISGAPEQGTTVILEMPPASRSRAADD